MGNSSKRRRIVVPAALAAVALGGVAVLTSGAWFTDSATVDSNTFAAGTVDLNATPAGTVAVTAANIVPGDVNYGKVTVANSGSLEFRYAVTQAATNPDGKNLAGNLNFDVVKIADGASCDASAFVGNNALTAAGNKFSDSVVFGDIAQGGQAGDRVLAAHTSEDLCFRVTLPASAGDNLQGSSTSGTLTFAAEQTKNNA